MDWCDGYVLLTKSVALSALKVFPTPKQSVIDHCQLSIVN